MTGLATRQNAVLSALESGACLTTSALSEAIGLDRKVTAKSCCKLISRGFVERIELGCFKITHSGRHVLSTGMDIQSGPQRALTQKLPRTPRRETQRQLIWRSIRTLKKFSLDDIGTISGASDASVQRYVYVLARAGYISRMANRGGEAPTSNGFARFLLTNDTGPLAPVWRQRERKVFDRNTGELIEVVS